MRPLQQVTPETCRWRAASADAGGIHLWRCGLIKEITGVADPELAPVSLEDCEACCGVTPPSPERPNVVTASILLLALEQIISKGGIEGCSREAAERLIPLAEDNLLTVTMGALTGQEPRDNRTRPCRHLGGQTGEQVCADCTGRVRLKTFSCRHPAHESTTLRACRTCRDHEPLVRAGEGVQTWAVGITTAPRRGDQLRRTLRGVRAAGWSRDVIHVFAEHGAAPWWRTAGLGPLRLVRRAKPHSGAWPSFLLGLTELYLRDPQADAYFMLQDDVDLVAGAKEYLGAGLWPGVGCGCVSLHTPRHLTVTDGAGFYAAHLGWSTWGAQALIFPNDAVREMLSDRRVLEHRQRGMGEGLKNVDSVVGDWCRRSGKPFWLHSPSLAEHTGLHSTLWKLSSLKGRRSSADFPGPSADIRTVMPALLAEREGRAPQPIVMRADGTVATAVEEPAAAAPLARGSVAPAWDGAAIDIVSVSLGRAWVWDDWCEWLLYAQLPAIAGLYLVDNAAVENTEFRARMQAFAARCLASGRFQTVSVTRGPGPAGERGSESRDQSTAAALNAVLPMTMGDLVFVLDDDVLPPPHAIRKLYAEWKSREEQGLRPGLVSGAYASATASSCFVAGYGDHRWERSVSKSEVSDGVIAVDFVGNGCLLAVGEAIRARIPIEPGNHEGWRMGADAWLCREFRRSGFSIWLDSGLRCEHRFRAPS